MQIDKSSFVKKPDDKPSIKEGLRGKSKGGKFAKLFSLIGLLVLWFIAAMLCDDAEILPTPLAVGEVFIQEFQNGDLWFHLFATLLRVICAFIIAMGIGIVLGIFMGRNENLNQWLDGWLIVLLNLPALVTFVLCYLWIGLTEVAAITGVAVNKIPMVIAMMREGAKSLNPQLDDMAKIFKLTPLKKIRHVLLPQLSPHIASTTRAGIALIWKIVLVVEFLGRSNGVGFQIHLGFQLNDISLVLSYAMAFIIVMLLVEFLIIQPFERRVNRWRG